MCPHFLLSSVCGDGGATRVWDRGERYAWTNPSCTPFFFCYLLSPTLCWVYGTHFPSLWWSSCMWCASHTVWMVFFLWLPVISVHKFLLIPLTFVGQYSALTQSNQENKGKQCLEIKRLPCRREMFRGERGRSLRVRQMNPLRLAEERRKCIDRSGHF
ncbi:putative retrotransposon hot spot protein (RHS,) [Trypanosoma cruzi]|uniref:Putative retrotransposon hot spot protein (RHS,) n=1 Tax=Trypanosoma cruzi TaxID=5693 RepID=A0A2V2UK64_TRYCR|nr:putative retrotransposon hot spot protein (RHS,) [Trypanosoma cruzi]